jgi:transposase-like protein
MATLSNGDWRRVRAVYVEGCETIEAIASRFGVSASAISWRREFEGWPPRRNAMQAQAECISSAQAQPDGIEPRDEESAPGDSFSASTT